MKISTDHLAGGLSGCCPSEGVPHLLPWGLHQIATESQEDLGERQERKKKRACILLNWRFQQFFLICFLCQCMNEYRVRYYSEKVPGVSLLRYWELRVEGSPLEKHQHLRKMWNVSLTLRKKNLLPTPSHHHPPPQKNSFSQFFLNNSRCSEILKFYFKCVPVIML